MDEDYPVGAPGYWPDPRGNWEGGCTDGSGRRWVHVPHEGWREQRSFFEPAPPLRRLTAGDFWGDLPWPGRVVFFGLMPLFVVFVIVVLAVAL